MAEIGRFEIHARIWLPWDRNCELAFVNLPYPNDADLEAATITLTYVSPYTLRRRVAASFRPNGTSNVLGSNVSSA